MSSNGSVITVPSDWQMQNQSNMHWDSALNKFSPILNADVIETDAGFKVIVDLPGVDAKDIQVSIEHSNIVIKAQRNYVHDSTVDHVHTLERSYGAVQRMIHLPHNADTDHAVTHFKNGVLTVTVPKSTVSPPSRKLAINQN